jgi:hypothetical protein
VIDSGWFSSLTASLGAELLATHGGDWINNAKSFVDDTWNSWYDGAKIAVDD